MKKTFVCVALAGLLATPAMGDLSRPAERTRDVRNILPASAVSGVPLDGELAPRANTAVYDSLTTGAHGWFAASPAVGALGYDDYGTISGVNLTQARFVGGVTSVSDANFRPNVEWFEYYDTSFNFVTSFGVSFPAAGNYFWTITFSSPPFVIPHNGFLQIVTNTTWAPTTWSTSIAGQWFMTSTDALTVGSNSTTFGGGSATTTGGQTIPLIHAFRFNVPEPTTLGLLGAGLLLLIRRRQ